MASDLYWRIRAMCRERGISVANMSKDAGVSRETMRYWRKEGVNPRYDTLQVVADYLGVTPYYLLYGTAPALGGKSFPDRLRRLRLERGLTSVQLSRDLGLSRNCVPNWERGANAPTAAHIRGLAQYFNVSTDALRYGEKED